MKSVITLTCKICGKSFEGTPKRVKDLNKRFCDHLTKHSTKEISGFVSKLKVENTK